MLEDYDDDPGNRGLWVEVAREGTLAAWACGVAEAGLSPSVHAIGDAASRMLLDAIEGLPDSCRPRLEHVQQLAPEDIPRFRRRVASMQPLHRADDARYVTRRLGEGRLGGFFAFRELLDAGAVLAFGSDWPVVSVDPMLGIRAACSCRTLDDEVFEPHHAISVEEALRAYTADAAWALGLDHVGVLKPGKRGDFVMLDTTIPPAEWDPCNPGGPVLLTVVGGEVVYDAR
jgi:predicted amidohydrolase YtcJ